MPWDSYLTSAIHFPIQMQRHFSLYWENRNDSFSNLKVDLLVIHSLYLLSVKTKSLASPLSGPNILHFTRLPSMTIWLYHQNDNRWQCDPLHVIQLVKWHFIRLRISQAQKVPLTNQTCHTPLRWSQNLVFWFRRDTIFDTSIKLPQMWTTFNNLGYITQTVLFCFLDSSPIQ